MAAWPAPKSVLAWASGSLDLLILLALILLVYVPTSIRQLLRRRALRDRLLSDRPGPLRQPWKAARRRSAVLRAAALAVTLLILLSKLFTMSAVPAGRLPLHLSDLENCAPGACNELRAWRSWSLLAGSTYSASQSRRGEIALEYSAYRLFLPGLAPDLLSELMERDYNGPPGGLIRVERAGLDQLWVAEQGECRQLFAQSGGAVLSLRYSGEAGTDHLTDQAQRLFAELWGIQ